MKEGRLDYFLVQVSSASIRLLVGLDQRLHLILSKSCFIPFSLAIDLATFPL